MEADWTDRFSRLEELEAPAHERLRKSSSLIAFPKGAVVFGQGRSPESLLLLLEGTVRVQQLSEGGREIVLYRVHGGESCIMTTACLLTHEDYSAEGIAETDVQAVSIPRRVFDDLVASSKTFREFVFSAYSQRIIDLFVVIEEVAFRRMDIRLAQKLLDLGKDDGAVAATHQQLAAELGTAREVVSRQLAEFQRRGWVRLSRGKVELSDRAAIKGLAEAT
ncbi:MAG: Crp/Fnr family transcriptional regulator [Rhodobacter sp.]|nr:Crp/Fnr family transcriptional regulator [Rhodobacter sp.]